MGDKWTFTDFSGSRNFELSADLDCVVDYYEEKLYNTLRDGKSP